jgi:hypothetical protein
MPEVTHVGAPATEATVALLWEACRREPDVAAIREAASGHVEPQTLVGLAVINRLVPLLWRSLVAAGCQDVLGGERAQVEELANLYLLQELLLHPQAIALAVGALTSAGFEPVVMKGPAVARTYPGPGLRPMDDLDLLLPRVRHGAALAALREAGWAVTRARSRDWYDTQLRHPDVPSMPLELHYGLEGWHERSNCLDPMWLWEQRVPIDCYGTKAFGLPLEIELVSLSAHAGKPYHGFDRLVWLADLAMVAGASEAQGGVDWSVVERVARDTQCVTVVSAALRIAARMGLSIPEDRFVLPQSGWRAVPLRNLLSANWPISHDQGTFHMRFALVDTNWRRMVLMAAVPYNSSWSERVHLPTRAAARVIKVWRHSHAASGRPSEVFG